MIIDRYGRPVWAPLAPEGNRTLFPQVTLSGPEILWDEATAWSQWDQGTGSVVHRTWLDQLDDDDWFDIWTAQAEVGQTLTIAVDDMTSFDPWFWVNSLRLRCGAGDVSNQR